MGLCHGPGWLVPSGGLPHSGHGDSYSILSLNSCGQMGLRARYSDEQGQGRDILGPTTLSLWTCTPHPHPAMASQDLLPVPKAYTGFAWESQGPSGRSAGLVWPMLSIFETSQVQVNM